MSESLARRRPAPAATRPFQPFRCLISPSQHPPSPRRR